MSSPSGAEESKARPLWAQREIEEDLEEAIAVANACRMIQRSLADELQEKCDLRHWFTRVYEYTTEGILNEVAKVEGFRYPVWILRLIPVFHTLYEENLKLYLNHHAKPSIPLDCWKDKTFLQLQKKIADSISSVSINIPVLEKHWEIAFKRMENGERIAKQKGRRLSMVESMGRAVKPGIWAHVEFDLPRTLTLVYETFYSGKCNYYEIQRDYDNLFVAFDLARKRMFSSLPRSEWGLWMYLIYFYFPDSWRTPYEVAYYDMAKNRKQSFIQGEAGLLFFGKKQLGDRNGTTLASL